MKNKFLFQKNNDEQKYPMEEFNAGRRKFVRNTAFVILGIAANGTIIAEVLGETLSTGFKSTPTAPNLTLQNQKLSFTGDQIGVIQKVFGSRPGAMIFVRSGAPMMILYGLSNKSRSLTGAEQKGAGVRVYFNEQQRAKLQSIGVKSCDFVDIPNKSALSQAGDALIISLPAAR